MGSAQAGAGLARGIRPLGTGLRRHDDLLDDQQDARSDRDGDERAGQSRELAARQCGDEHDRTGHLHGLARTTGVWALSVDPIHWDASRALLGTAHGLLTVLGGHQGSLRLTIRGIPRRVSFCEGL
jgi:hypothetical protein